VPAVWWNDTSGDWNTLANWNSGQVATVPVSGTGQVAPIGTQTVPTARLPGAAGSGPTSGQNDTVLLDRPTAAITVTLGSGTHNIRKLYLRETLNVTGGSLTANYVPVAESTPMSVQVSGTMSVSGGAAFSAHTIFVDAARILTAGTANLTFDTLTLDRGATPATLALAGNTTFAGTAGATAKIGTNSGTAASGRIDLGGAARTITVVNGTAPVDLLIAVPLVNGGLVKAGAGTMRLSSSNSYSGATSVQSGTLVLGSAASIASSPLVTVHAGAALDVTARAGGYTVASGQTLGGAGTVMGSVTFGRGSTLSPGMTTAPVSSLAEVGTAGPMPTAVVPEPASLAVLGAAAVAALVAASRSRRTGF